MAWVYTVILSFRRLLCRPLGLFPVPLVLIHQLVRPGEEPFQGVTVRKTETVTAEGDTETGGMGGAVPCGPGVQPGPQGPYVRLGAVEEEEDELVPAHAVDPALSLSPVPEQLRRGPDEGVPGGVAQGVVGLFSDY